ncbi:MAG TPA: GNAT family N-acetyltransferase [Candidatus Dormibacteraeota bacterium]|nr:GNAT family N-acetyltransferase [Candidatus Dormibacteraeota bacterium]HEX2680940.1 GNAT family N-acetyltransferase [Candidatus Dormibacteraeota bacterium]
MIGEIAPARVDPATADRNFWTRYHELRRVRQEEVRPDEPLQPDPEVEAVLKRPDPFRINEWYEISSDRRMLSFYHGELVSANNPEHATSKHLYDADFYVIPDARRQGIGRSWLPLIAERMRAHGCTTVSFWVEQDVGREFMNRVGADARLQEIESRLSLSELDWSMVERWIAEGQARSPHTKLEIYDGQVPEDMWPDYAPQLASMLNTMPFEGLDHGEIIITPEMMAEWYARLELSGEVQATVITREPDGVISGITDTTWAAYRRKIIQQMFTGVRPSARGRGIGKWIKAAMLLHLRDLHPDAEWVSTENAGSNAPMLKINRTLGFKPYRNGTAYQMSLEKLEARV